MVLQMSASNSTPQPSMEGDSFQVLRNAEDQHALWPAGLAVPEGWDVVAPAASRAECLAYVEAHWTDLRPRSLRRAMGDAPSGFD